MTHLPRYLLLLSTLAPALPAQALLNGYDANGILMIPALTNDLREPESVQIVHTAAPGTLSIVLVHTSLDVEGPETTDERSWASGVLTAYPFLAPVEWWSDPRKLANYTTAVAGYEIVPNNPSATTPETRFERPLLPDQRAVDHLARLLAALQQTGQPDVGLFGANRLAENSPLTRTLPDTTWLPQGIVLALSDERQCFAKAKVNAPAGGPRTYNVASLGACSIEAAAATMLPGGGSGSVASDDVIGLSDLLNFESGYLIHVQEVEVTPPTQQPNGPWHIKFKPGAVVRKRSLKKHGSGMVSSMLRYSANSSGAERWMPCVFSDAITPPHSLLYLGGRGDTITIRFDSEIENPLAMAPTTTGMVPLNKIGPVIASQSTPQYWLATFTYPTNGVMGYIDVSATYWVYPPTGQPYTTSGPVAPSGAVMGKAMVWAYDPNEFKNRLGL